MNLNPENDLLQRYLKDECTPEEKKVVENWYEQLLNTGEVDLSTEEKKALKLNMERKLMDQISIPEKDAGGKVYTSRFKWQRVWWAAAVFILVLSSGLFFFSNRSGMKTGLVVGEKSKDVRAPELNRAMITLANGEKIYIDSASGGEILVQGNLKLVKQQTGEFAYVLDGDVAEVAVSYNTVSNPKGSKVLAMKLADGTKFWLNAGSSLTYPVVFSGKERKVKITGEAYFEVAHNETMPFIVSKGEMEVKVLGTHFNVNAYDDEEDIKVTLLAGAVHVQSSGAGILLKPGQQAQVQGTLKVVDGVDVELVMAWKNGFFAFNGTTLEEMMRQIARWYDVKVFYEGVIPERRFGGKIGRDNNLSAVMKILEESNIHYRINGNEIFITK